MGIILRHALKGAVNDLANNASDNGDGSNKDRNDVSCNNTTKDSAKAVTLKQISKRRYASHQTWLVPSTDQRKRTKRKKRIDLQKK
mmetsp:Transcript_34755/g.56809  ORF Transcript_34755/g.56809 Transcript_34755/m.56809 type:complete len:86 (+) Transcript_34755:4485-4742(+)